MRGTILLSSAALAVGIAVGGWFVGWGFLHGRSTDRYVTVKGVSEREVTADVALWSLQFVSTDDDLKKAQESIQASKKKVVAFLNEHGIESSEIDVQQLTVKDLLADPYRQGAVMSRYVIEQTLMARTDDCEKMEAASQNVDKLVEAGVVLSSRGMDSGPSYIFTRLNDLKPEMIAEATAEARRAAEQFARDSGSKTGKIRKANQGVFVIRARDRSPGVSEAGQLHKSVRVVSTIEYYLED
jgi:hypothetical protein